jgi:hypothetical protein
VPPYGSSAFDWADVAGATYYQIQVSTSNTFNAIVLDQPVYGASQYTTDILAQNTVYWWRVKAFGASGAITAWAAPWTFITAGPLDEPVLTSPTNGGIATFPVTPTWEPVYTADEYRFQVSTDPSFGTILFDQIGTGTSYSFPVAGWTEGTLYYIRAKAMKACGESGWSTPISFTTDVLQAR